MKSIQYYANLTALPIFFIVSLIQNMWTLNKQAFRWSVHESKIAYASNRRCFKRDKDEVKK